MQKVLIGVFAHPDDEAFGPSGTILKEVANGTIVHLVTLTSGQAGTNPDCVSDLGDARLHEWRQAGELLGATSLHHLGYGDGKLNNVDMIAIQEWLVDFLQQVVVDTPDCAIELMTFDPNGITGHIDHIVAARATSFAFYTLKSTLPLTRLRYFCLTSDVASSVSTDWLYMEASHQQADITETIDARDHLDDVLKIMRTHRSQRFDAEAHIATQKDKVAVNHFIVRD